jgi:DNA-binding FrmR family transcriptional regulator
MKDIQNRLKRIKGQIQGLHNLLEYPDDCEKIIIQFQAVQGAFDICFSKLLHDNLRKCLFSNDPAQLERILKILIKQ